jgi:hypothetical protein
MAPALRLTASDLAPSIPPGGIVVAATDDGSDPRYTAVRHAAAAVAASIGGTVLLYRAPRSSAGIADLVSAAGAAVVLLPAEADRPGILHRTLEYRAGRIDAPVVAVDPEGWLRRVPPLGGRAPPVARGPAPGWRPPLVRRHSAPAGRIVW